MSRLEPAAARPGAGYAMDAITLDSPSLTGVWRESEMGAPSLLALARDVDATKLRAGLDSIRSALSTRRSPAISAIASVTLYDNSRVSLSLKLVLEALARSDVGDRSSTAPTPPVFGGVEQVQRLRQMLLALQPSWISLVLSKLGQTKVNLLRELIVFPSPDLLTLLSKADSENAHSAVIRWLLDPRDAKTIAPPALRKLVAHLDSAQPWEQSLTNALSTESISVRQEYTIGREWTDFDDDRIDLVISGADFFLAIENKLWSVEHDEQTTSYWKWLGTRSCLHGGIYLTPRGMPASSVNFKAMSYLELLSCLLEAPSVGPIDAVEQIVLSSYVKTLHASVLRAELRAALHAGR